jgi:hypothetical protein
VADVPPALDPVVLRALEPDAANRWPDVDSFVDALTRAAAGEDVPEALQRPARDAAVSDEEARRANVWQLALIAALVLVATFVASYFLVSRMVG